MRTFLFVVMAPAVATAGLAQAQTAPSVPSVQPSISGMSGDAADRFMERQTNYRRLDDNVSGSLRARPARAKDIIQGLEVRDANGLVVGTVGKVADGMAVLSSSVGSVEVDFDSFAKNKSGLLINLPKSKIEAMMTRKPPS